MNRSATELDARTRATVTVAWVLLINKPIYPLYVWYLVDHGAAVSLASVIAAPFFLAIPFLARRSPFLARLALPLIGTLDTFFETRLFGTASGTELFFGACIMLAVLNFHAHEKWWQRGMAVFVFAIFALSRNWAGAPFHIWSSVELAALLHLNAFAVASLMAFLAFRYAGVEDTPVSRGSGTS